MNKIVFPLLTADDIEVRIGSFNKDKTKCTLLLYKTARTDANILDNIIGCYNWQKKFYELKGVIYCSLGIYDEDRKEWVWKDDAGAETQVETEKGTASDAFKRAGFAWGLGRELYSAPTIWIDNPNDYTDFQVDFVSYDEKTRKIKELVISGKDKRNNFARVQLYPKDKKVAQTSQKPQLNKSVNPNDIDVSNTFLSNDRGSITDGQAKMLYTYVGGLPPLAHDRFFIRLEEKYGVGSIDFLSENQAQEMLDKIGK